MKKLYVALALVIPTVSLAQVSSTNGTFTATTPNNLSLRTGATPTARLTILQNNGNVGIDNTNPKNKLDVNGAINISSGGLTAPPAGLGYGLFPQLMLVLRPIR